MHVCIYNHCSTSLEASGFIYSIIDEIRLGLSAPIITDTTALFLSNKNNGKQPCLSKWTSGSWGKTFWIVGPSLLIDIDANASRESTSSISKYLNVCNSHK